MKSDEYFDRYIDGIEYSLKVIQIFKEMKLSKLTIEEVLKNEIKKVKEIKKNPNKLNIN